MVGEDQSTDGITSDKIYGLDLADNGKLTFQLDSEATKNAVIERTGIDMDGRVAHRTIWSSPIFRRSTQRTRLTRLCRSSLAQVTSLEMSRPYASAVTFDAATDHKIDSRAAGRYLSYKVTISHDGDFRFSGFDIDVTPTGAR